MKMKIKIVLIYFLLLSSFGTTLHAEMNIYNAQAIFIYNFLSHINWPKETVGEKYIIGVLGETATYDYLKSYTSQRKVGSKSIEIIHFKSLSEIKTCNILFVTTENSFYIPVLKNRLEGKGCLIVGEKDGTISSGASVNFSLINGKLRYKLDEAETKNQNLLVSASLIKMSL